MLEKLVLFYLVNGNNIAASADAGILNINNKNKYIWNTYNLNVLLLVTSESFK